MRRPLAAVDDLALALRGRRSLCYMSTPRYAEFLRRRDAHNDLAERAFLRILAHQAGAV